MLYQAIKGIHRLFKTGVESYINVECNDILDPENSTLTNTDGSITTCYEIKGNMQNISDPSYVDLVHKMAERLSGTLKQKGFKIQVVYQRSEEDALTEVSRSIEPMRMTASRLNLDLGVVLDERQKLLTKKTLGETCYIALTTMPSVMNRKVEIREREELAASTFKQNVNLKSGEYSLSPFKVAGRIRTNHIGFLNSVETKLKDIVLLEKLTAHKAISVMSYQIDRHMKGANFKPCLLGDKMPVRFIKESEKASDLSHILAPSLSQQLFSRAPRICEDDASLVEIGNSVIAPLMVDVGAQEPLTFTNVFSEIPDEVPYRISFELVTGHKEILNKFATKTSLSMFLGMLNSQNRSVRESGLELAELGMHETLVLGSITAVTWASDLNSVTINKQILSQALSNWGDMSVIEEVGDPIIPWLDSVLALTKSSLAVKFPMTIKDSFAIMPFTRPASPWESGSMMYRTTCKKLFPVESFSGIQSSGSMLVFAPSGKGKSFLLSALNTALALKSGNMILPRITVLDIGYSSGAFVEFIKASLPDDQKHLAQSFTYTMSTECRTNVFDLPLGCQFPMPQDKAFLQNILSMLVTPAGSEPISRLAEIVGLLIDEMYAFFSEDGSPKRYRRGVNSCVDASLDLHSIDTEGREPSWYQIVAVLHKKGDYNAAKIAQRFAVPTLSDATSVLSESKNIKDTFGSATISGESAISYLTGMLISAVSDYPVLVGETVFSIGDARICSIDLNNVVKRGSASAVKQSSIMYMLARNLGGRSLYLHADDLVFIPDAFKAYHLAELKKDEGVVKTMAYDEYHETASSPYIRSQVASDVRLGRKYKVQVFVLSQLLADFGEELISLVPNIILLSKGTERDRQEIREYFKPSDDAMELLEQHGNGVTKEGSHLLYLGDTAKGTVEAMLILTLGAMERWAYTTTLDDVLLKRECVKLHGIQVALKMLASNFPSGSATGYIDRVRAKSATVNNSIHADIAARLQQR